MENQEKYKPGQPARNGAARLHGSQWTVHSFQGRSWYYVVETGDYTSLGAVETKSGCGKTDLKGSSNGLV